MYKKMNFIKFTKKYLYEEILINGNTYFITQKLLKIIAYYIIPILLLSIGIFIGNSLNFDLIYAWSQFTSRTAFFLLILLLYLKPLMKIFPKIGLIRKLMIYRRQLGIATFYFAFFHMVNALFMYQNSNSIIDTLIWFKYGAISITVLLIMYLTSNNYSVKLFKKNWKKIQGLIHFSLAVLFIHMFLIYSINFKIQGYWNGFWDAFSFTFYIFLYYVLKILEYYKISFNFPINLNLK